MDTNLQSHTDTPRLTCAVLRHHCFVPDKVFFSVIRRSKRARLANCPRVFEGSAALNGAAEDRRAQLDSCVHSVSGILGLVCAHVPHDAAAHE